jgi:hypothetical protein
MRPHRRPGQSSLFALVALPVMLGAVVLVLVLVRQRDTSTELRNAAVASALAAADELAADALLTDDAGRIDPLFGTCRATAAGVGHRNLVEGKRLDIAPPKGNTPGDLLFGTQAPGDDVEGSFRPLPANPTPADLGGMNAVRLTARHPFRQDVFTRVTAVFDRHVVGFRPLPDRPAPLVPVALYDGPHEGDRPAWGHAVATGPDEWARGSGTPAFQPGKDGLREVTVRVGWQKQPSDAVCGFPLRLSSDDPRQAVRQIAGGVSAADLVHTGGELKLDAEGRRAVAGDPDLFQPEDEDDDRPLRHFRALAQGGDVRVWPVFSRFADDGKAVVVGFTAARVVAAEREAGTGAIRLTLQPAVTATPTALTHPGRPAYDPTVGRVRIAG